MSLADGLVVGGLAAFVAGLWGLFGWAVACAVFGVVLFLAGARLQMVEKVNGTR